MARHSQYDLYFDLRNDQVCSDRSLKVRLGDFQFGAKSKELGSKKVKSIDSTILSPISSTDLSGSDDDTPLPD